MIKRLLEAFSEYQIYSLIGLIIFFGIFCGVLWWTGRKESKQLYKKLGELPLGERENG